MKDRVKARRPQSSDDQVFGLLAVRMIFKRASKQAFDALDVIRTLAADDRRSGFQDVALSSVQVASPVRARSAWNGNDRRI